MKKAPADHTKDSERQGQEKGGCAHYPEQFMDVLATKVSEDWETVVARRKNPLRKPAVVVDMVGNVGHQGGAVADEEKSDTNANLIVQKLYKKPSTYKGLQRGKWAEGTISQLRDLRDS